MFHLFSEKEILRKFDAVNLEKQKKTKKKKKKKKKKKSFDFYKNQLIGGSTDFQIRKTIRSIVT